MPRDISFETGSTWEAQNGPSCSQKWTFQTICGDFENFHFLARTGRFSGEKMENHENLPENRPARTEK